MQAAAESFGERTDFAEEQNSLSRTDHAFCSDVAGGLIGLDVGDRCRIAAGAAGHGYASTARCDSIWFGRGRAALLPTRFFGDGLQYLRAAFVVGQVAQT